MTRRWEYLYLVSEQKYDGNSGWSRLLWIYRNDGNADKDAEQRTDFSMVTVLNEFGADGWELVAHEAASSFAFSHWYGDDGAWHPPASEPRQSRWIFKRPVDAPSPA